MPVSSTKAERHWRRLALAAFAGLAVIVVALQVTRPDAGERGPLLGPSFGLKDNIEQNIGGWFGGVGLQNPTDSEIEITAVWALDPSNMLALGPAFRGRGTPDPVIWPEINPRRLEITPLATDAVLAPHSESLDNSLIIRFDLDATEAVGILRGFRIDYRYLGETYSLYIDAYHCVAPDAAYDAGCSDPFPGPMSQDEASGLALVSIPFAK